VRAQIPQGKGQFWHVSSRIAILPLPYFMFWNKVSSQLQYTIETLGLHLVVIAVNATLFHIIALLSDEFFVNFDKLWF